MRTADMTNYTEIANLEEENVHCICILRCLLAGKSLVLASGLLHLAYLHLHIEAQIRLDEWSPGVLLNTSRALAPLTCRPADVKAAIQAHC